MSRGVVHSVVEAHTGHGTLSVPVCVAWAQCACGEALAFVGDATDSATAGLADVEAEDGWRGDACGACGAPAAPHPARITVRPSADGGVCLTTDGAGIVYALADVDASERTTRLLAATGAVLYEVDAAAVAARLAAAHWVVDAPKSLRRKGAQLTLVAGGRHVG